MRWLVLSVIGLLVTTVVVARHGMRPDAEPYTITWGGDTFLGDRGLTMLETSGYDMALQALPGLGEADLTVINAEAPLTDRNVVPPEAHYSNGSPVARYDVFTSRGRVTRYVHRAAPASARAFANAGVDVVSLANNHALDQGPEGVADSRRHLAEAGIGAIGAGRSHAEALQPHIVATPHGRMGILGFGEQGGTAPDATEASPGILALTEENLEAAQQLADREDIDWMVATVHWGDSYKDVLPTQERWARRLEAKGFDLIVGSGPHVVQRIEVIDDAPVLYSIGNLAFLTAGRFDETGFAGVGLLATVELTPQGFRTVHARCIKTDNKATGYQPRPCTTEEAATTLPQLAPDVSIEGPTATMRW